MSTHARCAKCRTDSGYLRNHPLLCDDCESALDVPAGVDRLSYAYGYAAALWEAWERDFEARHGRRAEAT